MSKSKIELIVVPVALLWGIMAFMIFFVKANRSEGQAYRYMLNNLNRINIAIKIYAVDAMDKMPDAKNWADHIIANQPYIQKYDFVTPYSHPKYGIFYNSSFEGCDISKLDASSVILFARGKGQWNASGSLDTFLRLSSRGRSYLITWNSEVYKYDSETKTARKIYDGETISIDELIWELDR
ncbi:MAG: hypothetical protein GY774_41515 [Planctomycetes bacterium]|nr:hypothetical protein [Planctomycetota bacterium]